MKLNFLSGLVSRLTLMLLLVMTALPASSATVSVEVDSATLTFSTSGGTATITRVGVAGYSEVRIPETITVDGETYTVTGISSLGNLAKYITAISIPGTVGDVRCFGECVNLKTLTIEPGPSVLTIGLLTASYGEYYPAVRQFANCPLETGIGDIEADDFKVSVYTLGGVMLIENADREQYDALAPGIYIVNGRKVYKKR